MNITPLLVALSIIGSSTVFGEEAAYATTPNKTKFPFPTELPAGEDQNSFDWKRYLNSATSKADRMFRARLAPQEIRFEIPGAGSSNGDEYIRYDLAATELMAQCDKILEVYRRKLVDEKDILARLNQYARHREKAMDAHVALVGGSWGGSGARVAIARSRAHSFANYLNDLRALSESLHFQE